MAFRIRKSVSAGPFRFNLSKSGAGLSVGVRGLRVGTGPRGHYVHAGLGGFSYRSTIGKRERQGKQRPRKRRPSQSSPVVPKPSPQSDGIEMIDIDSGSVLRMSDERRQDLLDDINAASDKARLSFVFGGSILLPAVFLGLAGEVVAAISVFCLSVAAYLIGESIDSSRRVAVVFYDLEPEMFARFKAVVAAFERLSACSKVWHIPSGGAVPDLTAWKRNAGASYVVARTQVTLKIGLPRAIRCNIDVPSVPVGKQTLYFFPDFLMVCSGRKAGAVDYTDLVIKVDESHFVEDESVPDDAEVVCYTWKHPNKSGGPDRRFRDNWELPVCVYEMLYFFSNSGVNELLETSRCGYGSAFAASVARLVRAQALTQLEAF